jgi:hypothetical protein
MRLTACPSSVVRGRFKRPDLPLLKRVRGPGEFITLCLDASYGVLASGWVLLAAVGLVGGLGLPAAGVIGTQRS